MKKTKEFWYILLSFFAIYIIWGSTYLANTWGIASFPPFMFASLRFSIAGLFIIIFLLLKGGLRVTKEQLKETFLAGFLFFALGNGLLVWGLQFIESGIAALIISLQPLVIGLMLWLLYRKAPGFLSWIGLGIGLIGMGLLVWQDGFISSSNWLIGFGAILVAMTSWAFISIRINDREKPDSIIKIAGLQMVFGGILLAIMSLVTGEFQQFQMSDVNKKALYSLIYLIFFGSIIAFSAFNYLLVKVSPIKVSTSAYINPIVALFLGWHLNAEQLSTQSIIATVILLTSVFLINADKYKSKKKAVKPA